ncbi:methyltransferase domain-containing protein [Chitinophaga sp. MM2321]|uniref:methyltransferase domain-containing protein n=1 Tax=Chitinophaga sp. MM2321 TaxID=3137178 RepID=UPI0032D573A4
MAGLSMFKQYTIDTTHRSLAPEIMDDFAMEGSLLQKALDRIAKINRLLGGNKITIQGVEALLQQLPADREVVIADIGCGNGDMLRTLAAYGRKKQCKFRLIGIDANNFTTLHAAQLSAKFPEISYRCLDVTHTSFADMKCDIVLCTLTLHHFKNEEIFQLMKIFRNSAAVGIVINDLHRNIIAYRLFQALCFVLGLNRMTKADGLTSILRGFKKKELRYFSQKLNLIHYSLRWKWAFRYQWVISNL